MIIRVVLFSMLLLLLLYSVSQSARSKSLAYFIAAISLAGLVFVIFPDLSTDLAIFLGVGRGADLIFYIVSLAGVAAVFNLHLRLRLYAEDVTELARQLAILNARLPKSQAIDRT